MSSFNCGSCNKQLIDTPRGYITGCVHYPKDQGAIDYYIDVYLKTHVSQLKDRPKAFIESWEIGQSLYDASSCIKSI